MTIEGVNLEDWLRERSTSVAESESETIFTHMNGMKSTVVRRLANVSISYEPKSVPLKPFYREFVAASLFKGMLILASTVDGGVHSSLGFTIPNFFEIKRLALKQNINLDERDEAFMTGSAFMFFYAYNADLELPKLRCYDRDFGTVLEDRTFLMVLEDLWEIILNDAE